MATVKTHLYGEPHQLIPMHNTNRMLAHRDNYPLMSKAAIAESNYKVHRNGKLESNRVTTDDLILPKHPVIEADC
jgi:hypothetical protein